MAAINTAKREMYNSLDLLDVILGWIFSASKVGSNATAIGILLSPELCNISQMSDFKNYSEKHRQWGEIHSSQLKGQSSKPGRLRN